MRCTAEMLVERDMGVLPWRLIMPLHARSRPMRPEHCENSLASCYAFNKRDLHKDPLAVFRVLVGQGAVIENPEATARIAGVSRSLRRRNSFDTLRLVGALIVLVGHSFIITATPAPRIGSIFLHSFGVSIFFAISGFLITQSWTSDPSWHRFLIRRLLRILPALVVVTTCTALIIGACATTEPLIEYYRHGWTWRYVISNSLLVTVWGLPDVFTTLPIHGQANGSLWTLPIEFGLYLTVPVLVGANRLIGRAWPVMVLCLSMLLIAGVRLYPSPFLYNFAGIDIGKGAAAAPYFLAGAALQLLDFGAWNTRSRSIALACSVAVTSIWAVAPTILPLPIAVLLIVVAVISIGQTSWLHSRIIEKVGDLSYGTYLWAFPLQQLVFLKLGGDVLTNLAIALPATISLAFASWHLIERQALRLKPSGHDRPKLILDAMVVPTAILPETPA